MVKIKGPLFSLGAHGSIGDVLTFSKKHTGQQARKYTKPLTPPSGTQRAQRRITEFLVAHWQSMTAGDKATWETNAKASGLALSGYHYFLRTAQRDLYTHHGLCGYWSFNEVVGGKILDRSGNAYHGTIQATYPNPNCKLIKGMSDRFGNTLKFSGGTHQVNMGKQSRLLIDGPLTLITWVYFDSLPTNKNEMIIYSGGYAWDLIGDWGNHPVLTVRNLTFNISGGNRVTGDISFQTGRWYQFGGTWDGTTGCVYINGRLEKSDTGTGTVAKPNRDLTFNRTLNGQEVFGRIDENCIYNRALPAGEMATRYRFAMSKI